MKRIVVLCALVFFILINLANAQIYQNKDDFTGGITIRSNFDCDLKIFKNKIEWTSFYKTINTSSFDYGLRADITTFKVFGLSEKAAQINIDGDFTTNISVLKRHEMRISGEHLYMLDYQIPQEVIDKLKTANRVALRFTQNSGSTFVYVLPDEVLAEWKQVINTTE